MSTDSRGSERHVDGWALRAGREAPTQTRVRGGMAGTADGPPQGEGLHATLQCADVQRATTAGTSRWCRCALMYRRTQFVHCVVCRMHYAPRGRVILLSTVSITVAAKLSASEKWPFKVRPRLIGWLCNHQTFAIE